MFRYLSLFLAITLLPLTVVEAYPTLKGMRVVDSNLMPYLPPPEHFECGMEAMREKNWAEAAKQFRLITHNFPRTSFAPESYFREGICRIYLGEYETANELLSRYLKSQGTPKFFLQAVHGKYCIAERFRMGAKRRVGNVRYLPKWLGGELYAIEIYDEIVAMVPCDNLAARALFSKGLLLWEIGQMKDSIHAYQTIIRQFPKHELAANSYVQIAEMYQRESELEYQNPDLLELARINARRFEQDFPKEERLKYVKALLWQTQEIHARGLYETARLYERKSEYNAACVYYQNALHQYPHTKVSDKCQERLDHLASCGYVELEALGFTPVEAP